MCVCAYTHDYLLDAMPNHTQDNRFHIILKIQKPYIYDYYSVVALLPFKRI